jgi:Uma2 family endonuclease
VKEYWIVLAPEHQVEVYRQPRNGRYQQSQIFRAGDRLECASVPALRLAVSDLSP